MYDHYDMEHRVNLDMYNEALHENDDLKQECDELKEDNEYLKNKIESLNVIIKELYRELKRKDAKDI